MKELFEKLAPKIKKLLKRLFWIAAVIFLLSVVCQDLDRFDDGYIRPTVAYVTSIARSCCAHGVEIANTPLASLTIAKIFTLIWYCLIAWFLAMVAYGIWSFIRDVLDNSNQDQIEKELQKKEEERQKKEEERWYAESQNECAEFVSRMQNATSLYELNPLFYEAIRNWPKWEKQLSRVYKEKKKWLEKNAQT